MPCRMLVAVVMAMVAALCKGTVITGALAALIFAYPMLMLMKGITANATTASQKRAVGAHQLRGGEAAERGPP